MSADGLTESEGRKAAQRRVTALKGVKKGFPKIGSTRPRQVTDFYSLTLLISKFESDGLILNDRRRNNLAWDLLLEFSNLVDQVRVNQRRAIGIKPHQETARDYLLTVSQMSDDKNQRRKR